MAIAQFTVGQVLTAAELNVMVDAINAGGAMKVETFLTSGTWTVPAGVTYAVAHIRGGGGGVGVNSSPGTGGTSSVAFVSGTVSAIGGVPCSPGYTSSLGSQAKSIAGAANSGNGATSFAGEYYMPATIQSSGGTLAGQNGAEIVSGAAVTAGGSITVTVGAAGAAGANTGAAGGSGLVYIEYSGG